MTKKKPHEIEPWFKCYPKDWLEATYDLKPEEQGLFYRVCMHIYDLGGPLNDDIRSMARRMNVDYRVWKRVRGKLLAEGFLYITCGKLMNKRCAEVMAERQLQLSYMGRSAVATPDVPPDLFGNPNDFNGGRASRSTDSDSERERESTSLRVITGGRGRHISPQALQEAADLFAAAGLKVDKYELEKDFWNWPKSATAVYVDASFLGFAGRRVSNDLKKAKAKGR